MTQIRGRYFRILYWTLIIWLMTSMLLALVMRWDSVQLIFELPHDNVKLTPAFNFSRSNSLLSCSCRDDSEVGRVGPKIGVFVPALHSFIVPHFHPAQHNRENFLTTSPPLGAPRNPAHLVKLYFMLICPTTSTIFLMKPLSLIKIYLKLKLNLSHQIKSIFRKHWIIYSSV